MERSYESCAEILARMSQVLAALFAAYGISEARSREILDDACRILISKRGLSFQNADGWLLRNVIEACRRSAEEEERDEDSSA